MEAAGALAKELGSWDEVVDLFQHASKLYVECGKAQPGADALTKGARFLSVILYALPCQDICFVLLVRHFVKKIMTSDTIKSRKASCGISCWVLFVIGYIGEFGHQVLIVCSPKIASCNCLLQRISVLAYRLTSINQSFQ